ncbi:MAG: alanine dehydrogenase, partial [Dehalococcoidia bacterium]|nr:alanine dehydrogenase [Dehalococcoidia bacterium]
MIVGTVRELKIGEHRVGLTPEGADALVRAGHQVLVEAGAGAGSGFADEAYRAVGAEVVDAVTDVWAQAELVVKVKEPLPEEFGRIRPEQILFTYLHLAALPETTRALLDSGAVAVAYETVQLSDGTLPLLIPMSQIAGRLATEVAAQWLRKPGPGRGKLLSGLPGEAPARVVILGAGTVSSSA